MVKFSVPQLHWLSSRCGFVFKGKLRALAHSQLPSQQRPITGWGCGCLRYLRAHPSAQNRNTSFCQCRIESVLLQPVFLTVRVKRMKEHFRQFAVGDVRITQLKLLGCNATFFFFLCEDMGSQFGAMHNLDASSVSSNIPWNPKLPAECLLLAHAYFMKSEAD